jgi:hypothetical protein
MTLRPARSWRAWLPLLVVLAFPHEYGRSGVMSFVVNKDGVVYQKDLGESTDGAAAGLTAYDPDGTWTEVKKPS